MAPHGVEAWGHLHLRRSQRPTPTPPPSPVQLVSSGWACDMTSDDSTARVKLYFVSAAERLQAQQAAELRSGKQAPDRTLGN